MPELKFQPPAWIAVYITVVQYLAGLIFAPLLMYFLPWDSSLCVSLFVFCGLGAVAREAVTEGLVLGSDRGLRSYTLGQFGKSSHFLHWDEIYRVEPYRYFGLRFLLVRYRSADTPLWLPLFLISQIKLNLLILEHTREDNPLHKALLARNLFHKVPWHSRVKPHKSDRYILESAYTKKISPSFPIYCKFWSIFLGVPFLLGLLIGRNSLDRFFWLDFGIASLFLGFGLVAIWYLLRKNSYIALKYEGIEVHSHFGESFIPWFAVKEITSHGFGIFQELRIWLKEPVDKINFVPVPIRFIDRYAFKKAILETEMENPLQIAAIKYL